MIKVDRENFQMQCEDDVNVGAEMVVLFMGIVDCAGQTNFKAGLTTALSLMDKNMNKEQFIEMMSSLDLKFPQEWKEEQTQKGS